MEKRVRDIVKFFDANFGGYHTAQGGALIPKSVEDFLRTPEGALYSGMGLFDLNIICKKLVNEGRLMYMGNGGSTGAAPITCDQYYSLGYNTEGAEYGIYEFLTFGFPLIRNEFSSAVKPVIVEHARTLIHDLGTGFVIADNLMITAKHCVEKMASIIIHDDEGKPAEAKLIRISNDANLDLALIYFEGTPFKACRKFKTDKAHVLEEVLTMGYPPIPCFDAVQVAETATIGGILKSSTGNIVGQEYSYLEKQDFILFNARVKGGNSGGPLINKHGMVVGVVTNILSGSQSSDTEKMDSLGYGFAIPSQRISELLNTDEGSFKEIRTNKSTKGFATC